MQAAGISIWASSQSSGEPDQSTIRLGCGITLAGLAVQLAFFACFAGLTIWSHRHPSNGLKGTRQARVMYGGLYTAMTFLTIRNLFRCMAAGRGSRRGPAPALSPASWQRSSLPRPCVCAWHHAPIHPSTHPSTRVFRPAGLWSLRRRRR